MRSFNIKEYARNPHQALVIEHYRNDGEMWPVTNAQLTPDKKCLVVEVPETGYSTDKYVLLYEDNDNIRDEDGNMVGYLRFAHDSVPFGEVVNKILEMKDKDSIIFKKPEMEYGWGINMFNQFGVDFYILGNLEDSLFEFYEPMSDLTDDNEVREWLLKSTGLSGCEEVIMITEK